jgi:hypothetical protein
MKIGKNRQRFFSQIILPIFSLSTCDAHNNFKVFPQNYIPSDYHYEYLLNYNLLQNLNIIDKYIDLSLDKKLLFEKQNFYFNQIIVHYILYRWIS